ncbi:GGDEF domain-containing protein [Saccharopolyspora subtropica]|uniref:EAL domain-containing protein n=1 Tax=Saccharopolyspora thermophila TaxID=89367 RepID=A0A917JSC0_9PSEU|nr:EAL domain-containing protein [Saccharopolyspora subtropica]GGI83806.1 GGDEF domain-containing protein [Saccharopolyspora subtropica]
MTERYDADGGAARERELLDAVWSLTAAVPWSFSFAHDQLTWAAGLDSLLGMRGAPRQDLRARLIELIDPLTATARSAPAGEVVEREQRCTTANGQERLLRSRARMTGDARTGRLLGITTDVTRSDEDRRDMADLAARYRLLVERSPEAIWVHQDRVVVYANSATARMLAAESSAQIVGRPITDFIAEHAIPGIDERLAALTPADATAIPAEIEMRRFDGSTLRVESMAVGTNWQGRPAFQVIQRDIAAQRWTEVGLHHQAALVQHVSDAIIATTRDGLVTSWNTAAAAIYGRPAERAHGQHISAVVGAPLDPAVLLAAGGITEARHRHSDGSALAVRVSVAEMPSGFVLVCADETPRRRAEQDYATVVNALDEGVIVADAKGLVLSANPAAVHILGTTGAELVGSPLAAWPLFDETGAPIPPDARPSAQTSSTGVAQNARMIGFRRSDGRRVWLAMASRSLTPDSDPPHPIVVSFTDITESRAIRERLEREATHDPLTGLANRTLVLRHLESAMRSMHRTRPTGVLFIDLDKFKVINDSLGHSVGDEVLRIVGERLRKLVREGDVVGRLGGDEFVVITHDEDKRAKIRSLAEQLRRCLIDPIGANGRRLHVDASIGIVLVRPGDPRTAPDVLRDADVAMYHAKTLGRGRTAFFDVQLRERMQRQLHLQQDLRAAAHKDQLWMAYQPIIDLGTGQVVAVEGLLRWTHPLYGTVSPGEFIPLAEESDLIHEIGAHMLRMASSELAAHRSRHQLDLRLKVNLSARQLEDPHLYTDVHAALGEAGLPASAVCLEVTESALMHDPTAAAQVLSGLRRLGVRLAIDDFGTGYSSLAQLQRLPLDTLKIDRSFITGIDENPDAEAIVSSIIAMAHAVKLTVVAEGVETAQQLELIHRLGCDQAQGFYIGKPAPAGQLAANCWTQ